jgi:hypothetical protein
MPAASTLLPPSSTALERAFAEATDVYARTQENVSAMRGLKIINPPPSFLPFLVYEYGLGELTPYVPNLYELIDAGIDWQRVRGTPLALAMALGWIGYEADLEEFPTRRRWWNRFMLALDRVRDDEEPDLGRIEGVAGLSVPMRSVFWRGFAGYDVRALEYGRKRWSGGLWGSYSGARIPGGVAKWSFGRTYDLNHAMTQEELEALGVWVPPGEDEGDALSWGGFPWPHVPWSEPAALARSAIMLHNTPFLPAWVVFKDADGAVIGYRRARACHPVSPSLGGAYQVGNDSFDVEDTTPTRLYVEALTDFGDGYGSVAASAGIVLNSIPADPHPPGAFWVPAGGLTVDGPVIAERPVDIEFGRTVRERVRTLLRF